MTTEGVLEQDDRHNAQDRYRVHSFASIEPRAIDWIWQGYLPAGRIVTFDGPPGVGKSLLTIDLAARITNGGIMPDGSAPSMPRPVLLLCGEDALAEVVRPRLNASGANSAMVYTVTMSADATGSDDRLPMLPIEFDALAAAVLSVKPALIVVDPFMAFVDDSSVKIYHDASTRARLMDPLKRMAEQSGACIILVRHWTKGGSASAVGRGGGTIGVSGAARAVFTVASDPSDTSRSIFASAKFNLARCPTAMAFRVVDQEGVGRVRWEGAVDTTSDQTLAAYDAPQTVERHASETRTWLAELLADGPVPHAVIEAEATASGFSPKQVRRARESLGVTVERQGHGKDHGSRWSLPSHDNEAHMPHADTPAPSGSGRE